MSRLRTIKPRIIVKKKGGFVGKIVAFFMGMIIGVSALIGSIAGVSYFVLKKPIKDIFNTVESTGVDIPGNLLDYLSADMATLTLLEVLTTVGTTAGGIVSGANTLGDLAKLSPILENSVVMLANKLSGFGISATKEEFLALNLTNAGGYLVDKIYNTPIADIVNIAGDGIPGDNALMCSLYYGKKGVHYTVDETNKAVALPLTYVLNENVFTDWDENTFEQVGDEWVYENLSLGVKTIIKEYQVIPANDGELTYSYEVYSVSGEEQTLLYQLVQDETTPTNYHAYKNGAIQKHKGLTIGAVIQGEDVMATVNNMALFDILSMNGNTPAALLSLAGYVKDENGEPVLKEGQKATTLKDLKSTKATDIINDMKISEVLSLGTTSDPIMLSLAYGNYTIDNGIVKPEVIDGVEVDRTLSDLTGESGAQNILQTLKLPVILNLNEGSSRLMLKVAYGDGYSEDASGNPILDVSKARTAKDFSGGNFLDNLTLSDVIDTTSPDTPQILKALKDAKINNNADDENSIVRKVNELTLVDILGEEEVESNFIFKHLKDSTLTSISDDISNLTVEDVFATDVYKMNGDKFVDVNGDEIDESEEGWESKRVLTGTWYYLLTDVNPTENTHPEKKHYLTNMALLVENMRGNIQTATLSNLDANGILELTDSTLDKTLSNGTKVGDLTIKELVDAFGATIG